MLNPGENCPRISRRSTFMLPIQENGRELGQVFTDLRISDTLKWKEAVIITEPNIGHKNQIDF